MPSNLKKIRDIERAIKKFGSTPELLAKLEEAKHGKVEVQLKEKMRKNSTKYHMVRFLERKKVTRMIRSIESKIKCEGESAKLTRSRDKLMDDLAYIMYVILFEFVHYAFLTYGGAADRYYPMEHKYIALVPTKESLELEQADSDGEKHDSEKSKVLSEKAREVALQRWAEEKQRVADGVAGAVDKVAHAMEVEYKGGAAVNASAGTSAGADKGKQAVKPKDSKNKEKLGEKVQRDQPASEKVVKQSAAGKKRTIDAEGSDNSSDSSDSSDSDSSDDDSVSDSDSEPASKTAPAPATTKADSKTTITSAAAAKKSTTAAPAKAAPAVESEGSDNDGDDFFVEEASESELANNPESQQPKVYNDGNAFRYKGERQSVHEIRFAATKRKYERHKRVFNNQNKRNSAQERKRSRQG
jgi:hypothetical protein